MYVDIFSIAVLAVVGGLIAAPDIKYARGRNVKKLVERTEALYRPSHIYFPDPFKARLTRYFEDRWPSSTPGKKDAYEAYRNDRCLLYAVVHVAYEVKLTRGFLGTGLTTAGCSDDFCDEVFSLAVQKLEETGYDLSVYIKNYRKYTCETEAFFDAHPLGFWLDR